MAEQRSPIFSRKQAGGSWVIDDLTEHPGAVWFVDSGATAASDAAGFGRNPDKPFATLDYAIGNCTASSGDVIYVMPGHAEVFEATNGFDADVAGVKIVGLGWGDQRPTFAFNDTDAQVNIGANGVWVENLRFVPTVSAVVAGVQVEGKTDVTFKGCQWDWYGTTGDDFVIGLELESGSHRATIIDCEFLAETAVAGAESAIELTGASRNVRIQKCLFMGDYSVACVHGDTVLSTELLFLDNTVHNTNAGEPYLEVLTGTTGVIANTRGLAGGATIAANAVGDAMAFCENFVVNTAGTYAIIGGAGGVPAVDAD